MDDDTAAGFDHFDAIRNTLLCALMAGELYYLWLLYKDTTNGLLARARIQRVLLKIAGPCEKCRAYRKARVQVLWQAYLAKSGQHEDERGIVVDD